MMGMKKKMVDAKVNRKREVLEEEEVRDCTWKPKITNYLEKMGEDGFEEVDGSGSGSGEGGGGGKGWRESLKETRRRKREITA